MKPREMAKLGIPEGTARKLAAKLLRQAAGAGLGKQDRRARLEQVVRDPDAHTADPVFGPLAVHLLDQPRPKLSDVQQNRTPAAPAPWKQWGENLDENSIEQMKNAVQLPIAVAGALMPDAHLGYGLPIGGVLATDNAVIPYAVGVDIACRMKMTVLDMPVTKLRGEPDRLIRAINEETRFGIGAKFTRPRDHDVMDNDWAVTDITKKYKDKAWQQLGTSGSGNHFVEFGILTIDHDDINLEPGDYLALLTHSGSRGTGAQVAGYYSRLAMNQHPELPKPLRHLAWLDLDSQEGRDYWAAMNLMGEYATANHAVIHRSIAKNLGVRVLADIENHHNFAWKERHLIDGEMRDVIVHRKGATPAGKGVLGIIPGSMATPAFIVRGRGDDDSLHSASHGAGRVMSRTQAKRTFTWSEVKKQLAAKDITLLSAGLDEVPGVYKDIHEVMSYQRDLVEVVAKFEPKIVKMAPAGERPED